MEDPQSVKIHIGLPVLNQTGVACISPSPRDYADVLCVFVRLLCRQCRFSQDILNDDEPRHADINRLAWEVRVNCLFPAIQTTAAENIHHEPHQLEDSRLSVWDLFLHLSMLISVQCYFNVVNLKSVCNIRQSSLITH
jgi:hypothetical protein